MVLVPGLLTMAFFASRAANGADDAAFVPRAREGWSRRRSPLAA
jgi:hypothetical protein